MKQYIKLRNKAIIVMTLGLFTACGTVGLDSDTHVKHNGVRYGTIKSPYTGRIWLDKNVGAERVCTASNDENCYGDYFQYGRNPDGHEKKNSQTRNTQIEYLDKSDDKFYIGPDSWWFSGSQSVLTKNWAKLDGSSVCPVNFRVASGGEFRDELFKDGNSAEAITQEDLFTSFLRLPKAGSRYRNSDSTSASINSRKEIDYWTAGGKHLGMDGSLGIHDEFDIYSVGRTIRCIKGTEEEKETKENS